MYFTVLYLLNQYPERDLNPHDRYGHRIFLPTTAFAASVR